MSSFLPIQRRERRLAHRRFRRSHRWATGLLAEQFPESPPGICESAPTVSGGKRSDGRRPLVGAGLIATIGWRWRSSSSSELPAVLIAPRDPPVRPGEWGRPRAASEHGSVGRPSGRSSAIRRIGGSISPRSSAAAGRGLGVVNLFALLYLTSVIGVPSSTTDVMYGGLIVLSVRCR